MGIIKTGKIQSHGNFNALDDRITALEDTYVRYLWFAEISSGTSGTITPPTGGTIVLDQWAAGVDAVTSTLTTTRNPTFESVKDAGGTIITATLAANGAWTISGTPSAYPIAILYVYEVKLISADRTKCLVEIETDQGLKTTDSPTFVTVKATTFDTNVAAAGVTLAGTTLAADGTDANIDINITPKGTGEVNIPKVDIDGGTITGITDLVVADGGTGASTLTDHGVLVGSGTDPVTALTVGTNGQVLVGSTGADPVFATITDGEGIDTTLGAGTLTIACETSTETNPGVVELATDAEAVTGTDTARAVTAANLTARLAAPGAIGGTTPAPGTFTTATATTAIADNTSSTQLATTAFAKSQDAVLARAPNQGVAMTAAASGSSGITVADNDNIDFGTGNFALVWKGSLPDWTPSLTQYLLFKQIALPGWFLAIIVTTGVVRVGLNGTVFNSTVAPSINDGTVHEISCTISVGAVNTTVTFYIDGVQLGNAVTATNETTVSNTEPLYILGYDTLRTAGTTHHAYTFNRALSAAEVLHNYRNGPKPEWFDQTGVSPASQTAQTSGTLVIGKEYTIDNWITNDDFTNVGGANVDGTTFVATGTTPTTWTNSSSLRRTGITFGITSEGMQPAPGQCLDFSGNKLHAWQPAVGSSLTRYKNTFEIRGRNTWAATHEAQSIFWATDASRAILPVDCYITDIIGVITGATIEDIIIGDGSDTDRWVTVTTGLATGTTAFTVANRISDGTNYEMVVDPDANFTGTIEWTIKGIILE